MKGFSIIIDGIEGTISPYELFSQTKNEMREMATRKIPAESDENFEKEIKELQARLKRAVIKVYKCEEKSSFKLFDEDYDFEETKNE